MEKDLEVDVALKVFRRWIPSHVETPQLCLSLVVNAAAPCPYPSANSQAALSAYEQ